MGHVRSRGTMPDNTLRLSVAMIGATSTVARHAQTQCVIGPSTPLCLNTVDIGMRHRLR